jgi:hypothetical protein
VALAQSYNWLERGGRINLSCFHGFLKKMRALICKATMFKCTQDTLKCFEVSIIIGIVGSNIDPSCLMFMDHFLQDKCMFGLCLLEWGVSLFHLHLHMVYMFKTTIVA